MRLLGSFKGFYIFQMVHKMKTGTDVLNHSLDVESLLNKLRARQNGRHFADDIFKCIFLNENVWISIKIPLKFVSKSPINTIPALVQIMAWRRPGNKPISEAMMVNLLRHIFVSRPQWFNALMPEKNGCHFVDYIFKCIVIKWFFFLLKFHFSHHTTTNQNKSV